MRPKSPLTKKLVGGQHRLPAELKQEILNSPAKMKVESMEKKTVKRLPTSKGGIQAEKDKKAYDKGELYTYGGRPKSYTAAEDKKQLEREQKPIKAKASPTKKRGLWDNIHAKRKRGETMRKKGDKGAPTEKAIKESQSPAKMKDLSGDGKITKKDVLIGRGVLKKDSPAKMVTAPDPRVSVKKKGTSKSIGPAESKAAINAKRNKMKAAEKQAQKDNPKEFMPESKASKKASKDYKDARSFVK